MQTIHKIAAVVIQDNKFFMVRKVGKDIWTSLGGHPEPGETEEQTVLREIKEEIGCNATILRKLGDFTAKAVFDDANVLLSTFLVKLHAQPNLQDPELEECAFLPKDYTSLNVKLPSSMEDQIIPFCIKEGLLKW